VKLLFICQTFKKFLILFNILKKDKKMLELKNISKSYGSQLILNDISFQVKANELVSILGPSGSGKSTLLQIIGLLNQADSGIVMLDDIDYSGLHEKDKGIFRNEKLGFVFQFHNLLPEFTCQENILFPLYIREKLFLRKKNHATNIFPRNWASVI